MTGEAAVIGRNVQRIRIDLNLSQEQLAKQVLGVHRTYVGSVERGERNLTITSLERLAKKLGTTPEALRRPDNGEAEVEAPRVRDVDETKWLDRLQLAAQPRPGPGYVTVRWRDVRQALEALGEPTKRVGAAKAKAPVRKSKTASDRKPAPPAAPTESDPVVVTIGRNIAAARKRRGWTQAEFAAQVGIHRTYVSRLERGQENPSVTALTRYAEALGLRITDLMHS